jgi:hypothetical protein
VIASAAEEVNNERGRLAFRFRRPGSNRRGAIMRRRNQRWTALGVSCVGLLLAAAPAFAQRNSSFGSSGGFGTTSIGGSGGSMGGSGGSMGGFGGSTAGGNSFLGTGTGTGANSFLGTGTGGTGANGGRGGATTQIGGTSFLGSYYSNPLAMGLSGTTGTTGTTTTTFGNPLYNLSNTGARTGTASVSSGGQSGQYGAGYNIRRLPAYAATIKIKDLPPQPTATQVQGDLQAMLNQTLTQSSDLDRRDAVQVVMDGPAVVLRGRVADDDESRLVENMVKLTPGVYQVRNELTMMSAATASRAP